jgi:hypothetical protein
VEIEPSHVKQMKHQAATVNLFKRYSKVNLVVHRTIKRCFPKVQLMFLKTNCKVGFVN